MGKFLTAICLFFCMTFLSSQSQASLRKGLFRLGLESTFFRFSVVDYNPEGNPDNDFENVAFGLGIPQAGLNIAGTVINGLVFGGRITIGRTGQDQLFEDDQYVIWSVLPYLEYVFLRGVFRPFITVVTGVEGVAHYRNDDTWWWGFHIAGGGGAHFFVHRHISIDLTLLAGFTVGGGERNDSNFDHWRFSTSCLFGVSGWF